MSNTLIAQDKVVSLAYSLKDEEGEVLDQSDAQEPFVYLHGAEQIVPGLENALTGLKVGDKKQVTVQPDEGYGEFNPDLRLTVKKTQFPAEAELVEGLEFETTLQDGTPAIFTIVEIEGDQVTVDGNHPLAGEVLHFDVEVLSIRDATADELSHGHAHGADGHHHH
jgi:FKBP-type peptidyl-prolyl cis-trans isomerase SlyD